MRIKQADRSLLLESFKEFFREVMLHKRAIQEDMAGRRPTSGPAKTIAISTDVIAKQLMQRLDQQHLNAFQSSGELGATLMKEAQYAMVALADEIFLGFDWAGRKDWEVKILEERVFHSHAAGEKIFQSIENLLSDRLPDRTEIGEVYLMVLGLGFRGQYMSDADVAKIQDIKQRLFIYTHHNRPRLYAQSYEVFSEGYANTVEDEPVRFFHDVRKWHIFIGVSALGYMLLTTAFWYHATHEVSGLAKRISKHSGLEKS
jgi:type VI secretion system protein ImpK